MSRSKGRRYDEPKLNMKKVVATLLAIVVLGMFVISLKKLLFSKSATKEISTIDAYFPVYTENKWGVMDNNGKIIIATIYDEMIVIPDKNKDLFICTYNTNFDDETYVTKVLNKNNSQILTNFNNVQAIENYDGSNVWYENNILKYEKDGKIGLIDFDGKLVLNAEYDNIYALQGIEKNLIIEKNGKKGLVNTSMGEIIISPEYDEISALTESYENGYIVKKDGKSGIISADAKLIFEPIYDEIKHGTSNGYYAVVKDGKLKLIKESGEIKLDSGFDTIESINADNMIITKNGKYGVINTEGNTIINCEYQDVKYINGSYYIVKKNDLYGIVSSFNEIVVDFTYNTMEYIKTADFIQADNANYKTDLIDREFKVVLHDVIVSELNLDDGYIRVREGDEYNYYNFKFEKKTNKEVLATNTLFLMKENGKYGYENKNGDRIVDAIYDDAKEQNRYGYCAVKKDGVWGCLKSDGSIVVAPSVNLDDYLYVDFINVWHLNKDIDLNVYTK